MLLFSTFSLCLVNFVLLVEDFNIRTHLENDYHGELNLTESFFGRLHNYHVNAEHTSEETYPWIAKVVHSRSDSHPIYCTASCVDRRIFITAASCLYILNVAYTTVIYNNERLSIKAFVVPSKETKQQYDDIGLIVVNDVYQGIWHTVDIYKERRPDTGLRWFLQFKSDTDYKVIGYATLKGYHNMQFNTNFNLTALQVSVDIRLCHEILSYDDKINGFHVPCYHSCSLEMFFNDNDLCNNYHGVEGGALFNTQSEVLFGIATWGAQFNGYELPVGFSVPNSDAFLEDFACAQAIREDKGVGKAGYLQRLCDKN